MLGQYWRHGHGDADAPADITHLISLLGMATQTALLCDERAHQSHVKITLSINHLAESSVASLNPATTAEFNRHALKFLF